MKAILRTSAFTVRQFSLNDATELTRWFKDPGVLKMVRGRAGRYTARDAKQYIRYNRRLYGKEKKYVHKHVYEKIGYVIDKDGQLIGGVGFTPFGHKAEIGYWLARPYWGQGIMTKVVRAFSAYLATTYRFGRLEAKVFSFNPASGRVLEKAGYKREALIIRDEKIGSRYYDHILYGRVF